MASEQSQRAVFAAILLLTSCYAAQAGQSASSSGDSSGSGKKPCICPLVYAPVCGINGKTYSNACFAACELGNVKGSWIDGACHACICTEEYDPVCGSDGKTKSNACFATCELAATGGNWTKGACPDLNPFAGCLGNVRCLRNSCDDGCATAPAGSVCFQNTCGGQTLNGQPVEPCAAVWVDPVNRTAFTCPKPKPTISCLSKATVECFADPCRVSSCPAHPNATCLASYCLNGTIGGRPVGPCEAVYVDASGIPVDCAQPPQGDIYTCPPDAPRVMCTRDNADPCANATCPGFPGAKCISKPCDSTYGLLTLPACSPIWVHPGTDELVTTCSPPVPRQPEPCICPYVYEPVCAKLNGTLQTYPNSCAAKCAGATIKKTGKCSTTSGGGSKGNDVCFLSAPPGSPQCGSKKTCRPAAGTPAALGLGQCLAPVPAPPTAAGSSGQQQQQLGRRLHRHSIKGGKRQHA